MRKPRTPQIVGVIFSRADLRRALRMRRPPDLFELRLDALAGSIESVRKDIEKLSAPLIITARHPREGGAKELSSRQRRNLLLAFVPHATWLDIELRSVRAMAPVLRTARAKNICVIISFHDFRGTPSAARLDEIVLEAQSLSPAIVKIVTRTDSRPQLDRLLQFFGRSSRTAKLVAMGIGKLGQVSRRELARRGCALNYGHLGSTRIEGQLSVNELRRVLR